MSFNDEDIDVLAATKSAAPQVGRRYEIELDAPVLPTLASQCECELVVKDNGAAMLLYTRELPELIEWAEYDVDLSMLTLVTWSGRVMGLGMKVHAPFRKYLKMASEIALVHMENGVTPRAMYPAKLVIRNMGF
ncbi:MAG: hypothetical protein WC043_10885 [Pseudobdellovibrionaceae bacterium]